MQDPLADPTWNRENPRWIRAMVWAAQCAARHALLFSRNVDDLRRCAACAADIPSGSDRTRCSKCKLVYFCDRDCQLAAHPVHKHYCTDSDLANYAVSLKVLHDKALEEPEAPIQGCMIPPSYGRLVQMIDIAFPAGQQGGAKPSAQPHELYQAAAAAQWISRYNQEKNIIGKVWQYSMVAASIAKQLKWYQLRSDALQDQVGMLQYKQRDSVWGQSSMDQCNEILQIAEQFQDVHLLALAANTKAALMKRQGVKGSEEYAELSKQCFVDMMKASKLRGNAGLFSLLMATALLVRSLLDSAYGLMATSSFGQAEKILHEAQQYSKYGSPVHRVEVLAGLANNCELATSGGKQLLEQAAMYRQKLFAEMASQKKTVPKQCAECHKEMHPHRASEAKEGQNSKTVSASCGHLFHKRVACDPCMKVQGAQFARSHCLC